MDSSTGASASKQGFEAITKPLTFNVAIVLYYKHECGTVRIKMADFREIETLDDLQLQAENLLKEVQAWLNTSGTGGWTGPASAISAAVHFIGITWELALAINQNALWVAWPPKWQRHYTSAHVLL